MKKQPKAITLTGEHVGLCRALLCQDLLKVSEMLASGKSVNGRKLTEARRRELVGFSIRLQLTLMVFGLSSSQLENLIHDFGNNVERE
jgi:hypothetical protein